jgi:hypothetical protein
MAIYQNPYENGHGQSDLRYPATNDLNSLLLNVDIPSQIPKD